MILRPQQNKRNVYVASLPEEFTEEQLVEMFSPFGKVISTKLVVDRETGKCKGFGFVLFSMPEEASAAIHGLMCKVIGPNRIQVRLARDKAFDMPDKVVAPQLLYTSVPAPQIMPNQIPMIQYQPSAVNSFVTSVPYQLSPIMNSPAAVYAQQGQPILQLTQAAPIQPQAAPQVVYIVLPSQQTNSIPFGVS